MTWVQEARLLKQKGMPPKSFELILHRSSPETTRRLLDGLIKAARSQDAVAELRQRTGASFDLGQYGLVQDSPQILKDIIRGQLPVHFDTAQGKVWDVEQVIQENQGEWEDQFEDKIFSVRDMDVPAGGWDVWD